MNGLRPGYANVGKLVPVAAPSYLALRAQHPTAFAIQPTPTGYKAVVQLKASHDKN